MTLPATGSISAAQWNTELGQSSTAAFAIGNTPARTLAGKATGAISYGDGRGKSNRPALSYTVSAVSSNLSIGPSSFAGYVAGSSDITITVGAAVSSTSPGSPALTINAFAVGDTVTLIVNALISGCGGNGGSGGNAGYGGGSGGGGGPAMSIYNNVSITNNNTIAGGGGGGGGGAGGAMVGGGSAQAGGGGGGGGRGVGSSGGSGGSSGQTLYSGKTGNAGTSTIGGSGGASGSSYAKAGGAGGAGGATGTAGGTSSYAAGGAGGAAGKCINLNGKTVTWVVAGARLGTIS